jgi:flavin-binding protein dodecin
MTIVGMGGGESGCSSGSGDYVDGIPPTVPSNLVANTMEEGVIYLSWIGSTDNVDVPFYIIYRDGSRLTHVDPYITSLNDDWILKPEWTYCYTVCAQDFSGNMSAHSNQACATTLPDQTPPTIPTDLVLSSIPPDLIDITWAASDDAYSVSGYRIYKDGAELNTVTETSTSDTILDKNIHCYTVSAYDAQGNESTQSSQSCTTAWSSNTVDSQFVDKPSIAIDSDDKIHISYLGLKYATNVSDVWVIDDIDDSQGTATHHDTSIAIDSADKVHIGYIDFDDPFTNYELKYATNASGAWISDTLDSQSSMGREISIAIDSANKVHISYFGGDNDDLMYATNATGAWVTEIVDSQGDIGKQNSIAIDSADKVHISYSDYTNRGLKYATNASGAWTTETLSNLAWANVMSTSIAIDSADKVHISYYNTMELSLKYVSNASGTWVIYTIDGNRNADVGRGSSIAIDSGDMVHISYYDSTNGDLKYATNAYGMWHNYFIHCEPYIHGGTSIAVDSLDKIYIIFASPNFEYVTNK